MRASGTLMLRCAAPCAALVGGLCAPKRKPAHIVRKKSEANMVVNHAPRQSSNRPKIALADPGVRRAQERLWHEFHKRSRWIFQRFWRVICAFSSFARSLDDFLKPWKNQQYRVRNSFLTRSELTIVESIQNANSCKHSTVRWIVRTKFALRQTLEIAAISEVAFLPPPIGHKLIQSGRQSFELHFGPRQTLENPAKSPVEFFPQAIRTTPRSMLGLPESSCRVHSCRCP